MWKSGKLLVEIIFIFSCLLKLWIVKTSFQQTFNRQISPQNEGFRQFSTIYTGPNITTTKNRNKIEKKIALCYTEWV